MHLGTTTRPKKNEALRYIPLLSLLLLVAAFSLSCKQQENTQNQNEQQGNKAIPSPTKPSGTPVPIVVTGGSLDLKLRPGFNPNSGESVFTCENCRFTGDIEFRNKETNSPILDPRGNPLKCPITSQTDGIIRIDAKGNKPDIVIAAAGGNITVTLDSAEYPATNGDRLHRYSSKDEHGIKGVFVKASPAATETDCQLPGGNEKKAEVTIPAIKN
jgi:hypothetical protein